MRNALLSIHDFPHAIVHIDGDAFFASCEQARDPALKGKPVITGKERGIVASMSYEAKARGVTRAMRLSEVKRVCPDAIVLPSNYETYSLLSKRFFSVVRRYTPDVEEYGIDECFADITGLRRPLGMNYTEIALQIQADAARELGFTFSVGLGPNKVIAKIASKWKKPSGFTSIQARDIHLFIASLPIEKVWGIGPQTAAFLQKHGIRTALDFAMREEGWIISHVTKPFQEIWQELSGKFVFELELGEKTSYASIQKVQTFTPPSSDRAFVFAQLCRNIENATMKARRYQLAAKGAAVLLKTQDFHSEGVEVHFSRHTALPQEIIQVITPAFDGMFKPGSEYRSTGIVLLDLGEDTNVQLDLFGAALRADKMKRMYASVDRIREHYGKHTVHLGASFLENKFARHAGHRGDAPEHKEQSLKGETSRRRLGIPMFMGKLVD